MGYKRAVRGRYWVRAKVTPPPPGDYKGGGVRGSYLLVLRVLTTVREVWCVKGMIGMQSLSAHGLELRPSLSTLELKELGHIFRTW